MIKFTALNRNLELSYGKYLGDEDWFICISDNDDLYYQYVFFSKELAKEVFNVLVPLVNEPDFYSVLYPTICESYGGFLEV